MPYLITMKDGRYVVYGKDDNGAIFLDQPFNPFTGQPFASTDECMEFLRLVIGASDEQIQIELVSS